jgi:hypothetical protein
MVEITFAILSKDTQEETFVISPAEIRQGIAELTNLLFKHNVDLLRVPDNWKNFFNSINTRA